MIYSTETLDYLNIIVREDANGAGASTKRVGAGDSMARIRKCKLIELLLQVEGWNVKHTTDITFEASYKGIRLVADYFHVRVFVNENIFCQMEVYQVNQYDIHRFMKLD